MVCAPKGKGVFGGVRLEVERPEVEQPKVERLGVERLEVEQPKFRCLFESARLRQRTGP